MFKFTFKFTLTFKSVFFLKVELRYFLCWEVEIWYASHPNLNLKLFARVVPGSRAGVGLKVIMYNRIDRAFGK